MDRLLASRTSRAPLRLRLPLTPPISRTDPVSEVPYDCTDARFSQVTVDTPSASTVLIRVQSSTVRR